MNLNNIRSKIASVLSGVVNSTGYPPVNISTADLPIAVLLVDRFYGEPRGIDGNVIYTLTFRIDLLVSPVAQSKPEAVIATAESKLVSAVIALAGNPTLDGEVDHQEVVDGKSVHVTSYGGTDYYSGLIHVTYIIK